MKIVWYGQSCFHISTDAAEIVTDPYEESVGLALPELKADIVLQSHDHFDHRNVQAVKSATKGQEPFVVTGPGEYNARGVSVYGVSSYHDESNGTERGPNTMYVIHADGVNVAHLGDLGQKELTSAQIDALGWIDVLLIPVGGSYTVDGARAAKEVHRIEPQVVIPMHYKIDGLEVDIEDASRFLKEMGEDPKPRDSFEFRARDSQQDGDLEVIVLKPKAQ